MFPSVWTLDRLSVTIFSMHLHRSDVVGKERLSSQNITVHGHPHQQLAIVIDAEIVNGQ